MKKNNTLNSHYNLGSNAYKNAKDADNEVVSLPLHNLMNGNVIYYRFVLKYGNYAETSFSLSGSKNVSLSVLGSDLSIKTK